MAKARSRRRRTDHTHDAASYTLAQPNQTPQEAASDQAPLAVPLGEIPAGVYVSKHVEAQLDGPQAATLRRVLAGLDRDGARLANGRRVTSSADAVRWLLENIAAE